MEKAQQVREENDKGAMKESASLLATNYIQEYMDKRYVQMLDGFANTYTNAGTYAKHKFPGAIEGGYIYAVSGNTLTVKDVNNNSVIGTILDNGNIDWSIKAVSENSENNDGYETEEDTSNKSLQINQTIGQIVTYPRATDTTDGYDKNVSYNGSWRVFYADDKQLFIIPAGIAEEKYTLKDTSVTTETVPKGKKDTTTGIGYESSDDVFLPRTVGGKTVTYGLTYNSRWKEKLGSDKDSQYHSIATAYMCDPSNWTKYVASNAPAGTYAVGGPTIELLAAAWEATGRSAGWAERNTEKDVKKLGYVQLKPSGFYDKVDNVRPIQNTILPTTQNGIDGLFNNGTNYLLASPCSYNSASMCYVVKQSYVGKVGYDGSYGLRPLVSIPIDNVTVTGTDGNYIVSLNFVN